MCSLGSSDVCRSGLREAARERRAEASAVLDRPKLTPLDIGARGARASVLVGLRLRVSRVVRIKEQFVFIDAISHSIKVRTVRVAIPVVSVILRALGGLSLHMFVSLRLFSILLTVPATYPVVIIARVVANRPATYHAVVVGVIDGAISRNCRASYEERLIAVAVRVIGFLSLSREL